MVEEVEDYAILMLDSQGIIRNWNKGARKIKGYTEAEIVGNHFRVFYTKEDRDAGLPEKLIDEATRMGRAVHEGWRVRKDGTTFWGSIVITALHDRGDRVIGFSKVTRDLTARKVAEDKLVRYARQLETQNMELHQFAYAAAHDMKEPLRKVQFYYSAIKEEGVETLSKRQRDYLQRSADATTDRGPAGIYEDGRTGEAPGGGGPERSGDGSVGAFSGFPGGDAGRHCGICLAGGTGHSLPGATGVREFV